MLVLARDFFRSRDFAHGLILVDSFDIALEQMEYAKPFFTEGLFCASMKAQPPRYRDDEMLQPFAVCIRAHEQTDYHAWHRTRDGHQEGQSLVGWRMAAELVGTLTDRDEARSLNPTSIHPLDWSEFRW